MNYHKQIAKIVEYFHHKIYKNAGFHVDITKVNNKKLIDNFLKLLAQHYNMPAIGSTFLVDYFCFTWHYWSDKITHRPVPLNWLIGKKIFARWLKRHESYQYFYGKFLLEYDINTQFLKQELFEDEMTEAGLDPAEELEKLRFDDEARLYNCLNHTTMYNVKSGTCLLCKQKSDCKSLLKIKYPMIFKKRGYK